MESIYLHILQVNPFIMQAHISYKGHDRTATLQHDHKNHRTVKVRKDHQTSPSLIPKLRAGSTTANCRGPCLVGYNKPIAWIISSSLNHGWTLLTRDPQGNHQKKSDS